jgi:hypothetical protein
MLLLLIRSFYIREIEHVERYKLFHINDQGICCAWTIAISCGLNERGRWLTLYGLAAFCQTLPQANTIGWFCASWCADRFIFKDSHQKTLLGTLTPENTQHVYLKVAELQEYVTLMPAKDEGYQKPSGLLLKINPADAG